MVLIYLIQGMALYVVFRKEDGNDSINYESTTSIPLSIAGQRIHISDSTYSILNRQARFIMECRGKIEVKVSNQLHN